VRAFCEAVTSVTPSGKINSFANHGRPDYVLAETGTQQPRTLAGAFLRPVKSDGADDGLMLKSITALESYREKMDAAYGACASAHKVMNIHAGGASAADLATFAAKAVAHA
jgi:CRISPR system Cascade subunit CasC